MLNFMRLNLLIRSILPGLSGSRLLLEPRVSRSLERQLTMSENPAGSRVPRLVIGGKDQQRSSDHREPLGGSAELEDPAEAAAAWSEQDAHSVVAGSRGSGLGRDSETRCTSVGTSTWQRIELGCYASQRDGGAFSGALDGRPCQSGRSCYPRVDVAIQPHRGAGDRVRRSRIRLPGSTATLGPTGFGSMAIG